MLSKQDNHLRSKKSPIWQLSFVQTKNITKKCSSWLTDFISVKKIYNNNINLFLTQLKIPPFALYSTIYKKSVSLLLLEELWRENCKLYLRIAQKWPQKTRNFTKNFWMLKKYMNVQLQKPQECLKGKLSYFNGEYRALIKVRKRISGSFSFQESKQGFAM